MKQKARISFILTFLILFGLLQIPELYAQNWRVKYKWNTNEQIFDRGNTTNPNTNQYSVNVFSTSERRNIMRSYPYPRYYQKLYFKGRTFVATNRGIERTNNFKVFPKRIEPYKDGITSIPSGGVTALGNDIYYGSKNKIWRSQNNGATWTELRRIPFGTQGSIRVQALWGTKDRFLIVATNKGAYLYDAITRQWQIARGVHTNVNFDRIFEANNAIMLCERNFKSCYIARSLNSVRAQFTRDADQETFRTIRQVRIYPQIRIQAHNLIPSPIRNRADFVCYRMIKRVDNQGNDKRYAIGVFIGSRGSTLYGEQFIVED